jgi:ferredoxin
MLLKNEQLTQLLDMLADESAVYVPFLPGGALGSGAAPGGAAGGNAASGDSASGDAGSGLPRDSQNQPMRRFAPYQKGSTVEFGTHRTGISPKALLFPQTETLYTYSQLGEDLTISEVTNETNQVLFGVRSCDVYSIDRLDEVFLTRDYIDTLYYERRLHTLIVALGCTEAGRSCFCTSFGINPAHAPGADIQLTEIDDGFFVEALTNAGKEAVRTWAPFLTVASLMEADLPESSRPTVPELELSLVIDTNNITEALEGMFESLYWNDLSLKCLNCGICAFVCPSCHCFDMGQSNRGNEGYRFRTWDSCTYTNYTLMAGFHNPRPTKKERLRNRFMHKLSFYEKRYGSPMCCGCGRCIELCPVGIDISRVIQDAQEHTHDNAQGAEGNQVDQDNRDEREVVARA